MKCPLTGKPCSNAKEIHFVQEMNGKKTEGMICHECEANPIANFWGQIFGNSIPLKPIEMGTIICTGCNCTLQDIKQSGRLGCPQCYETFRDYLEPVLQRSHGSTTHKGKVCNKQFQQKNIEDLQIKLDAAIKEKEILEV
jgi:protein arginine kinase activator